VGKETENIFLSSPFFYTHRSGVVKNTTKEKVRTLSNIVEIRYVNQNNAIIFYSTDPRAVEKPVESVEKYGLSTGFPPKNPLLTRC